VTTPVRAFREQREKLSPQAIDHFQSGKLNAWSFLNMRDLETIWQANRNDIVTAWINEAPGTRPHAWWTYDAPEPRRRLRGTGSPISSATSLGVPKYWSDEAIYGPGVIPVDPGDPPRFESEATYLKRHGLLFPGEAKHLTKADFDTEIVR
jgi:hypothetical protein